MKARSTPHLPDCQCFMCRDRRGEPRLRGPSRRLQGLQGRVDRLIVRIKVTERLLKRAKAAVEIATALVEADRGPKRLTAFELMRQEPPA